MNPYNDEWLKHVKSELGGTTTVGVSKATSDAIAENIRKMSLDEFRSYLRLSPTAE